MESSTSRTSTKEHSPPIEIIDVSGIPKPSTSPASTKECSPPIEIIVVSGIPKPSTLQASTQEHSPSLKISRYENIRMESRTDSQQSDDSSSKRFCAPAHLLAIMSKTDNIPKLLESGLSRRRPLMITESIYTVGDLFNFKLFETRLRAFIDRGNTKFTPYQMASAGFDYINDEEVQCVFCFVKIKNLSQVHNIELTHRDLSPTCTFNQRPFGPNVFRILYTTGSFYEATKKFLKLECAKPTFDIVNIRYSNFENRLNTLNDWQKNGTTDTHMINICKAGFYYSGNKDWFVCFCCGSSIRAEKLRNVPWNFHRTMKPWCQFLILSKGRPFLRKMHFTHNPILDGPVNEMKFEALINHLEHKNNCYIFVNHEKEFRLNSLSKQMRPKNPIIPNFKLDVCTVNPKLMQKEMLCRICGKERMEVVFLPCNHLYSCIPCSVNSKDCKQCGKEYSYAIRLFVYYAYNYHIMDGTITFVPYLNPLLCKMCEYSEIEVAFIPCKHLYSCFACAAKLDKCLLCNIKVAAYINLKLTSLSPDL